MERKNKDSISVLGLPVEKQVFTKTKKVAVGRNRTGKFYFLCFGVRLMLLKRDNHRGLWKKSRKKAGSLT